MKAKRISTLDAADLCPRPLADIEPAALGRLSRQALEAVAVAARDVVLLPDSLGDGIRLVQASGIERLQASIAAAVEAAGVSERRRRGDYLTVLAGRE